MTLIAFVSVLICENPCTNALEPWVKQLPLIGFDALAHEAAAEIGELGERDGVGGVGAVHGTPLTFTTSTAPRTVTTAAAR